VAVTVPAATEQSELAEPGRPAGRSWAPWLVLGCYLLGAFAVTWRLWVDPVSRAVAGTPRDVDLFAWYLRYEATAIAHGRLPALVTTAMNAPRGINLMWNTALLLPGLLLTPVTLLAGPQASLTIVMTAGFAGSAASMFAVLRRWQAGLAPAAIGGAVYGFSPALVDAGIGHFHLQFAVLPPLIIDAVLRTGFGSRAGREPTSARPGRVSGSVRTGLWLGLLTSAQLFTGEELLADTAVAALVLAAALVVSQPRAVLRAIERPEQLLRRAAAAACGLGVALAVTLLICGRALWVQFRGPLSQHGSPWPISLYGARPAGFVTPPATLLFHTAATAAAAASGSHHLTEYLAYLGWPLLVVLVAAAILFWREPRVRVLALAWAVLEVFSLGGTAVIVAGVRIPGKLLPWHWLQHLPVLSGLLPDRFAILADGAAAALLAFAVDAARSPDRVPRWRRGTAAAAGSAATAGAAATARTARTFGTVGAIGAIGAIGTAVAVLAVLPLIPLPYQAAPVSPAPVGWQAAFARLRLAADARVLVVPVPGGLTDEALRWQAETGVPSTLIGGYFIGPNKTGHAQEDGTGRRKTAVYLDRLWSGRPAAPVPGPAQVRADLGYWRPAAVVADTRPGSRLARVLTRMFGPASARIGSLLVWRRPARSEPG
jgi:hypothetical protein